MSSFTAPLILEALPDERDGEGLFAVHEPFAYEIGSLGSGEKVVIPAGFTTDLCTIPRLARPFFPLSGRAAKAALVHDYMLKLGDGRAASVFKEALEVAGVPPLRRWIMVAAVKLWAAL